MAERCTSKFGARASVVGAFLGLAGCGGPNQGFYGGTSIAASGQASSGASGTATGITGSGSSGAVTTVCGAGDPNLPSVPTVPPACTTLQASLTVAAGTPPDESARDTARIQGALDGCAAGQAVELTTSGASNAFITGPLNVPSGVTLWVDAGTTLYGTRDPNLYGAACLTSGVCAPLIGVAAGSAGSGIVGAGVIDGQGGEPMIGETQSWWDVNGGSTGGGSPALIGVAGATNFTLFQITLHNSPKFHVKLNANGFVVWGITIKTPSAATNSVGTALSPASAHNTDGIDPGESASNGYIVCNDISDGDDHIAIKGGAAVDHLTIAHNHFLAGHGMSIGSETNGGVSNVNVYDLSIDGTGSGLSGGSSNGIRIKSDPSRGGLVSNVTYTDVCVRQLSNPIILTPQYTDVTGSLIPQYTGITISNFHALTGGTITLDGYDAAHLLGITLDNVVVEGLANVSAAFANVTLGPGSVSFAPSGTGVTLTNAIAGSSTPNACTGKWVTF